MRFAVVWPWWGYALAFGAAVLLGWLAYARVPIKLPTVGRIGLSALRALTLILLIVMLLRPVVMVPPAAAKNSLLPVLVDISRSMRLHDDDGPSRLERAQAIVRDLQAQLGTEYRLELLTFGEALTAAGDVDRLSATARRSDLSGAIADLAERYQSPTSIAGAIVLSDGGDTAATEERVGRAINAPIFTVGIGSTDAPRDREIVNLTAGEPLLPGASIDVSVSATSHGFGTEPVELREAREDGARIDAEVDQAADFIDPDPAQLPRDFHARLRRPDEGFAIRVILHGAFEQEVEIVGGHIRGISPSIFLSLSPDFSA